MTSWGETATIVGATAGLEKEDLIFCQYRELSALYYRGFTIQEITDNCTCNHLDKVKGRQMPIHFTNKNLNFMSISSPLATQISQAAGFGYGLKLSGEQKVNGVWFGEGAASEGDFYAGINFAQTLGGHTLFLCRYIFFIKKDLTLRRILICSKNSFKIGLFGEYFVTTI